MHVNAGPQYLPDSELVANPPIPFGKNTVLRGRRTKAITELEEEMVRVREAQEEAKKRAKEARVRAAEAARVAAEAAEAAEEAEGGGEGRAGKGQKGKGKGEAGVKPKRVKKRGTAVHPCPAENCNAAFKRSEHLRRHYKSVHRGEKRAFLPISFSFLSFLIFYLPGDSDADFLTLSRFAAWPCTIEGCGKSFSRKDNLQQHVRSLPPFSLLPSLSPHSPPLPPYQTHSKP